MSDIDKSIAIKIGSGKTEIIEFVDVECSFCRQSEQLLEDADVTRYVFLYPLGSIHPHAVAWSIDILCSEDPAKEFEDIMHDKVMKFHDSKQARELLNKHIAEGNKLGVDSVPTFWVNGEKVIGAGPKLLKKIK